MPDSRRISVGKRLFHRCQVLALFVKVISAATHSTLPRTPVHRALTLPRMLLGPRQRAGGEFVARGGRRGWRRVRRSLSQDQY